MDTESAGDILQIVIPSVAYGTTLYLDDKEGENQFYKSFATNLGVTHSLKFSINKKRPNGGDYSFPSGHTSAAFQGASFIHKRYGLKYAVPAYMAATFVGYSRVECDAHYTEDVIAGAIIGTLSSFYFTTKYNNFEIKPTAMNGGYGISFQTSW
jgi:membrane-associated phospholipid phosphatase